MKKGNAAVFLLIISVISLAITSYLSHRQFSTAARASGPGTPMGRITSAPATAKVGQTVTLSAQIDDSDKNLAQPLSVFSEVIKLYYSNTASASNPDAWTEIPSSQASYQCFTDAQADHCTITAQWTPEVAGTYTIMVNGMDMAGNHCSGNPFFNYSGQSYWSRCGTGAEDNRQIVVSSQPQVAGHVRNTNSQPIANVDIAIVPQGTKEYIIKTDAAGYFSLTSGDLPLGKVYTVRVQPDPPPNYKNPPRTTNVTHSVNSSTGANTPFGSVSYDNQKVGSNDCGPVDVSGVGCDFEYAPVPPPVETPTPKQYTITANPATMMLEVGQTKTLTTTLKENGVPITDANKLAQFTYYWSIGGSDKIRLNEIQMPPVQGVKAITGLKGGQVTLLISVANQQNILVAETVVVIGVTEPTATPTPSPSLTPTNTPTPTPTKTPTPTPTLTETPTPTITLVPTACALKTKGDANCNGVVNFGDYTVWRQEFLGKCTATTIEFKACGEDLDGDGRPMDADFNLDGKVGSADYTTWRINYLLLHSTISQ